jgi:hypothetical protein
MAGMCASEYVVVPSRFKSLQVALIDWLVDLWLLGML